jgi:hypothetical protein
VFEEKVDFPPVWRDNVDVKLGAGVTQLVECDLPKVDVAGSNPVSRSNAPKRNALDCDPVRFKPPVISSKSLNVAQ